MIDHDDHVYLLRRLRALEVVVSDLSARLGAESVADGNHFALLSQRVAELEARLPAPDGTDRNSDRRRP